MSESLPESWSDMRLDSRILEAIKDLKWAAPLSVQKACIPNALRGNDMSLQSRTGSGKTGAFAIPMLQRFLSITEREKAHRKTGAAPTKPVGLILVPSLELCEQTLEATEALAKYIKPRVVIDNLCARGAINDARILSADIVVSTAAALAKQIKSGSVSESAFRNLKMVVMDEVDMVIAISERSIRLVQTVLPQTAQGILCSATLTEGVASIKGQLLHNPVHITLTADDDDVPTRSSKRDRSDLTDPEVESRITLKDTAAKTLKQYYLVATDECHKHSLLFALYRLKLIEGKTLIFADDEDSTYHLEHFLQQLGVACVVYDTTLPTNARLDILRRFQKGEVGTLICTDSTLESAERMQMSMEGGDVADGDDAEAETKGRRKKRSRVEGDASPNSALHRGVDFNKVRNVIIFDGMSAATAMNVAKYTHRVGRTGRGGQEGLSIILVNVAQARKVIPELRDQLKTKGDPLRPFKQLDRTEATKLQYRVDTVLANVTRSAARKLRVATVATELARSSYLSTHMTQRDNEVLERIVKKSSKAVKCDRNLLELPKYMELKKTDNARDYGDRVNLRGPRKEQAFLSVTRKKHLDPLKAVVAKVRSEKRAKPVGGARE
jgi:ATP-dependent RNA helicase DDX56/DBP9